MGVGVFVVVAARQASQLPVETLAAGVFFAGIAPAIAAPVAERLDKYLQIGLVGEHRSAFTHGDMVRGVEADSGNVAKRAYVASLPCGTKRIAAILDEPEVVFPGKCSDGIEVKDIPQGVGDHDCPGLFAAGSFELADIDLVGGQRDIHEDRYEAILNDRIDCSREARSDGNYFVARFEPAVAEFWRCECADGEEVGRGAGVDQRSTAYADK